MNWRIIPLIFVLVAAVCQARSVRAADNAPSGQRDLGREVRGVFEAKCTACHGSKLAKPKGRFGYVLDLARVAGNPEMVVPFRPAESELWELVKRGEMPPADAPAGALTAQQKEVIREWIAAGAPPAPSVPPNVQPLTPSPPASPPLEVGDTGEVPAEPAAPPLGRHFLQWIGKFHLLVLHFPIALLVVAAVGEFWSVVRRSRVPDPAVRFCLLLGATSVVTTVALGWLHALGGNGAGMPRILTLHRWLGTTAGLWVIVTAVLSERDVRRGVRSQTTRVLLFVAALLIGLTGHFGGILVHGVDFFDW
jgi:uncharacterized membrane protein/mono/diheme cytochrome c family protein